MGGMTAVVVLALLMVPVFFVAVQRAFSRRERAAVDKAREDQVDAAAMPHEPIPH
jgi:multidrug efflux pump